MPRAAEMTFGEWVESSRLWRAELSQPIVDDLRAAGVPVESVWDLQEVPWEVEQVLPVLVDHLERGPYPGVTMAQVGRMLAVPEAVRFWDRIKAVWLSTQDGAHEAAAATALKKCATADQFDDLVAMLHNEERGFGRLGFLSAVARVGGDRGMEVLESLSDHPLHGFQARWLADLHGRRT